MYPERVDKLVYLDAAYDRADLASEAFSKNPFPTPQPTKEERSSLAEYRKWWERNRGFWSDAVETDLRETSVAPDGTIKATLFARSRARDFQKTAEYRPDYTKIKAPHKYLCHCRPAAVGAESPGSRAKRKSFQ